MEVKPEEVEDLPNLHTLRLGRVADLKPFLEHMNPGVRTFGCHNLESEWIE